MTLHNLINAPAVAILATGITSDATSLTVSSALNISAPFKATFVSTGEIIEVGAANGTAWSSITRGAEGTTPSAYNANEHLELRLTAGHLIERQPFNVYPSSDPQTNTLAIRAAIASGYVSMAPGVYKVARIGTETALFQITDRTFEFDGNQSEICVAAGTPTDCDIFHISPYPHAEATMLGSPLSIHDLNVYPETNGDGRHAFHFDAGNPRTGTFEKVSFQRVITGFIGGGEPWRKGFGGHGFHLSNPTGTDAMDCCSIRDCAFHSGGMFFENVGDSVVIDNCQITTYGDRWAIEATVVSGAGQFTIKECNGMVGRGIKVTMPGLSILHLLRNNFEINPTETAAPSENAMVYVDGGQIHNISGNRFLIDPGGFNCHCLRLLNTELATVVGNQLVGRGTGRDLMVEASCTNTYAPQASNDLLTPTYSNLGTSRAAI